MPEVVAGASGAYLVVVGNHHQATYSLHHLRNQLSSRAILWQPQNKLSASSSLAQSAARGEALGYILEAQSTRSDKRILPIGTISLSHTEASAPGAEFVAVPPQSFCSGLVPGSGHSFDERQAMRGRGIEIEMTDR